jgi:CheY-like chemotaxis protein
MSSRSVILWAEDNDDDALLMERAFRKAALPGSFVRVADGIQATEYLSGQGRYSDRCRYPMPKLLLLDIKMPRMSGLDVLQWKQSRPELRELAAVILTSSAQERDRDEASRLGARRYLVKPGSFEDLVGQVKELSSEWLGPSGI